ncbi:afadin- and alpha-actinin-binding protein A-like [Ptychodera flava]|uniref:afadin- and alpha-actinin-binding protein A-like n=1 Tax=Ptychodera flava TaxID=63121 RepID=UPI00396A6139
MADWSRASSFNRLTEMTTPNRLSNGFPMQYILPSDKSPSMLASERPGLQFTPSPQPLQSKLLPEKLLQPVFCTRDNVDQCIAFLDQELVVLGFPPLYTATQSDKGPAETFDIVRLINCTFELLQTHQKSMRLQEEYENRQHRNYSDMDHLQANQTRLKEEIEQGQRDIAALCEKERQLKNKNKSLLNKVKTEKEELRKLEGVLKQRDSHFKHEIKKKEREINKLKERVHQLLTDKTQERRIGMDILNSLQRSDGKRGTWKTSGHNSKNEEDMYRLIITSYEERQKELMLENQDLRESLRNMEKELVDLLNQQSPVKTNRSTSSGEESEDESQSVSSSIEELSTGHYQMPYEMVREGIENSMRQKWRKLKERIKKIENEKETSTQITSRTQTVEVLVEERSELQKKVEVYRKIIEQQEQLLTQYQNNSVSDKEDQTLAFLKDAHLLEEKESFSQDKRLFYQQKAAFEEERRKFTEAAIRLGHERKKFEEEKATFLQQQFLQMTTQLHQVSPTLRPAKSISTAKSPTGRTLPATPAAISTVLTPSVNAGTMMMTPQPGTSAAIKTPNTIELFRAMQLVADDGQYLNESINSTSSKGVYSLHGVNWMARDSGSEVSSHKSSSSCEDLSQNSSLVKPGTHGSKSASQRSSFENLLSVSQRSSIENLHRSSSDRSSTEDSLSVEGKRSIKSSSSRSSISRTSTENSKKSGKRTQVHKKNVKNAVARRNSGGIAGK